MLKNTVSTNEAINREAEKEEIPERRRGREDRGEKGERGDGRRGERERERSAKRGRGTSFSGCRILFLILIVF
jgi:hypothetical protein